MALTRRTSCHPRGTTTRRSNFLKTERVGRNSRSPGSSMITFQHMYFNGKKNDKKQKRILVAAIEARVHMLQSIRGSCTSLGVVGEDRLDVKKIVPPERVILSLRFFWKWGSHCGCCSLQCRWRTSCSCSCWSPCPCRNLALSLWEGQWKYMSCKFSVRQSRQRGKVYDQTMSM